LTLEGLIVSYFVRAATAYDTLLQMGRWFGYRPGYADLSRIWMTSELEEWFADLATVEAEIRQDIELYDRHRLTPVDFAVRVRQHPQMSITARMKMQAAKPAAMDYSGKSPQTLRFDYKNRAVLKSNLEAGQRLVYRLIATKISPISDRKAGKVAFTDVPVTDVLQFLNDYSFHGADLPIQQQLLTRYIEQQNALGDLLSWTVGIVGRAPGGDNRRELHFADGISVPLIVRSRLKYPESHAYLKAIKSKTDSERITSLLGVRGSATDRQGLIMLYPIDKNSKPTHGNTNRVPLDAVDHLLGIALVFPKSSSPTPQNYLSADLSGANREEPEDGE